MYKIENELLSYTVNDEGLAASIVNKLTGCELITHPMPIWKLIYSEGETMERPVFGIGQSFTCDISNDVLGRPNMKIVFERPSSDNRELDLTLTLEFSLKHDRLTVTAKLENRDECTIPEVSITAFNGISSLCGDPNEDSLMYPMRLGMRVPAPSLRDLSTYAGFRKYERHDFLHTDIDRLYPGECSMQWYDLYNEKCGIYVGSHDSTGSTVCLHIERDVKHNLLGLGMIFYPFCETGEIWRSEPVVYVPHKGDWHAGAKIYRSWMESVGYTPPVSPDWMQCFEGWLRVILKPQHCEINWDYSMIPELFDEAQAAGLDTIFLLGWEKGGFARMWPDYELDERLGGEEKLRAGIEYVHSKGGRVAMFLSYFLIDHKSEFYLNEGGDSCTIRNIWDEEIPFSETYCGEGTYRKMGSTPMPMFAACPGSPLWQEKMMKSAEYCLKLGADAVLYDLGGRPPYFCFSKDHEHKKPSRNCEHKALKYRELRELVRSYGNDRAIFMEDVVDIFNESMDLTHGSAFVPRSSTNCPEIYRYTFPEHRCTNREMGLDENNYRDNINYTFMYGLSYDMTIYRCCGRMSDIPNYAVYMSEVIALRKKHAKYLHYGKFTDRDGFTLETSGDASVDGRSYLAADGSVGVALWNLKNAEADITVTINGRRIFLTVPADGVAFAE